MLSDSGRQAVVLGFDASSVPDMSMLSYRCGEVEPSAGVLWLLFNDSFDRGPLRMDCCMFSYHVCTSDISFYNPVNVHFRVPALSR